MNAAPAALVVLAGLPGTGKSHLAAAVALRCPVVVVRTDTVRKALVPRPTYSPVESGRVYWACHAVLRTLLSKGYPALFDATNLTAAGRCTLRCITRAAGAPYFLVWVEAAPVVVRERLMRRGRQRMIPMPVGRCIRRCKQSSSGHSGPIWWQRVRRVPLVRR